METEELLVFAGVGVVGYIVWKNWSPTVTAVAPVTVSQAPIVQAPIVMPVAPVITPAAIVAVATKPTPTARGIAHLTPIVGAASAQDVALILINYNINPELATYAQMGAVYGGTEPVWTKGTSL